MPLPDMTTQNAFQYRLTELDEAAAFVLMHKKSAMLAFYGAMGAGKTTLIKAICKQLGIQENISSPTFSLVNEYRTASGETVYHFDFYRIKSIEEAYDMGYEDYFYSGNLCLIEWPEKVEELLNDMPVCEVAIKVISETERMLELRHV